LGTAVSSGSGVVAEEAVAGDSSEGETIAEATLPIGASEPDYIAEEKVREGGVILGVGSGDQTDLVAHWLEDEETVA
jgi:hypothetical protein